MSSNDLGALELLDLNKQSALRNAQGLRGVQLALTGAVFADGEPEELTSRLLGAFDVYLRMAVGKFRWLQNPKTERWGSFAENTLAQRRAWIEEREPEEAWEVAVSGGSAWNDASEYYGGALRTAGVLRRRGYRSLVHFAFPTSWLDEDDFDAVGYLTEIASILRGESGWLGFGLVLSREWIIEEAFQQAEYATARRFEGIDVGSVAIASAAVSKGIKAANWLTVLGDRWVLELGGIDQLRRALEGVAQQHDYDGGVVIQAGSRPVLADKNRGKSADAYRGVGRVLASVRTKTHGRIHKGRGPSLFDKEATLEWLGRFDD